MEVGHCYIDRYSGVLVKVLDKKGDSFSFEKISAKYREIDCYRSKENELLFGSYYVIMKNSMYNQIRELWRKAYITIEDIKKEFVPTQIELKVGNILVYDDAYFYIDEIKDNYCYTWDLVISEECSFFEQSRMEYRISELPDMNGCYLDPSHAFDKIKKVLRLVYTTMNTMERSLYYQYVPKSKQAKDILPL